ncbi:right-handed parallel beta-helix repeat-containing protein [Litoribaculum gwangyangense]|uniref:Right handed beta helix domain-containing protein n=1 Tax=Litoribaculum gwangyangense TaxID=1130722 RepID=A0ABP9CLD2_9FLAO
MIKQITIIFLVFCVSYSFAQNTYYFSSSEGNDSNAGNEGSPFQTISKLNSLSLAAGDKILFKRGDTFIGQIVVSQSGANGAPIIYDSYGTGDLPVLSASDGPNGNPDPLSTIRIIGKQYLEFHNLKIENARFDTTGTDDDKSFGIYIQSFKTLPGSGNFEDAVLFNYFRFSNLVVQNIYSVNSNGTAFNNIRTTGIYFLDAFVNDVIIEDCYFTDIERCGIWLRKYVSDAIIRNNKFIDLGGSGTIISASKRVLYEKNLMRFTGSNSDPRMTGRGSGMWVFGSDDVVAQYNSSQHARGDGDSSGMHVDYGNTNILFQYNYSEDSAGGFCETLGANDNIIWRYNISVNDGTLDRGGKNKLLWVSDYAFVPTKSTNVFIYNNTIYQGKDYKNVIGDSEISLKAASLNFMNNIIYLEPAAKLGEKAYLFDVNTPNFSRNIMYGGTIKVNFKNLDATKIIQSPLLLDPGRRHYSGYKLVTGSPALGAALSFTEPSFPLAGLGIFSAITSNATKDIYGNPVNLSGATNIGADNGSGEPSIPTGVTYEAESGIILGGSQINCTNGSGGKAVNVGSAGQTLTFNNVNVSGTDLYLINVFYANPFKSSLKVTVNAGETESIILPYSDAYCYQSGIPTSFPIIKTLNNGDNTIMFEQGIIDKIEVVSVNEATLSTKSETFLNKVEAHLEKTIISSNETLRLIINKEIEYKNTGLYIYDMTGALLAKKDFYSSEDISMDANNLGTGVKIIVAKVGQYVFVDKIIIY